MAYTDYGTLAGWRTYSGIPIADISDSDGNTFLNQSIHQIIREASVLIVEELVTKEAQTGYYFPSYRYFFDADFASNGAIASPDATITVADIIVYEYDSTNLLLVDISNQIASINSLNNYFSLNSGYPTAGRSVYVTYRFGARRLNEMLGTSSIAQEAVYEFTTILALKKLRTIRLKKGISGWTAAGESVTKDENQYNMMLQNHLDRYSSLINRLKPMYIRAMKTFGGKRPDRLMLGGAPLTYGGHLEYQ